MNDDTPLLRIPGERHSLMLEESSSKSEESNLLEEDINKSQIRSIKTVPDEHIVGDSRENGHYDLTKKVNRDERTDAIGDDGHGKPSSGISSEGNASNVFTPHLSNNQVNFHGFNQNPQVTEYFDSRLSQNRSSFEVFPDFGVQIPQQNQRSERTSQDQTKTPNGAYLQDDRYHLAYQREGKWAEVRKYSDFIHHIAMEAAHREITKESYYELYNMAVCLLKSVDSLDPDKNPPQRKGGEYDLHPQVANVSPVPMNPAFGTHVSPEMEQHRKSLEYYLRGMEGNFVAKYPDAPIAFPNQVAALYPVPFSVPKPENSKARQPNSNYTGEVFFDDLQTEDANGRRTKRRRRRTVYSSRRNLQCQMCGVTETPEWRRGPAGDHTLCNACGLHYAKSLKKQRKEREGRKHSIEMLLNVKSIANQTII